MSGWDGQWLGDCTNGLHEQILVDIEIRQGSPHMLVYLISNYGDAVSVGFEANVDSEIDVGQFHAKPVPVDMERSLLLTDDAWEKRYDGYPTTNGFLGRIGVEGNNLRLFHIDINGDEISDLLYKNSPPCRSVISSYSGVMSWRDFRDQVTEVGREGLIYRGQSKPWPLCTSFHRSGRSNLLRFVNSDIPRLHRTLSAYTDKPFYLERPDHLGAFLSLIQHHGFPTPLLDWSRSPYVAAWFALRESFLRSDVDEDEPDVARVFVIDSRKLLSQPQYQHLTHCPPHFSLLEALSIENPRVVPQQGLFMLTNLANPEEFLLSQEILSGGNMVFAFDINRRDREEALDDLRLMGITEATLFPGIEGACLEDRRQNF